MPSKQTKKHWWLSKTAWVNIVAAAAILIQVATGEAWIDAELQSAIIVIINFILRFFTKQPIGK